MRRRDFHYDLPPELIAQRPLPERSGSRMLCLDGASGEMRDRRFEDLPALLRPGDLLVLNDTRVIPARLLGHKASGGRVEALIERVTGEREASVHLRVSKRPAMGSRLVFGGHEAEVLGREDALYRLEFDAPLGQVLSSEGHVPLPPYIRRADDEADARRYQTVYARRPGAVAAPTAGLHFTTGVLASIAAKGVATCRVTLHVGAGTFQPVRSERIDDHRLHREWLEVDPAACAAVASARERGGRVVAVGTTSVRALESAARQPGGFAPMQGETELFLFPGQPFKVVDALLTNFHLPESTLLMLVCAFAGYQPVMAAYHHAVTEAYRFFSYGDAMFVTADPQVRRESS